MKKTYLYAIYFFPGDEQSMETLKLLRLLFRAIETGATLDRTNAMLTVNTNAAINLRENLSYVQMVVESMMQKSSADLDFCLQQKSVIEALEMRSQMQDQKVRELRLEMTSLEQCNENGELFQVLDCLGDVINEAQRLGTAMRESLCFYTGPYGSDSFKLQIYYRMVSSQRGLLLQFGVYVKSWAAGPVSILQEYVDPNLRHRESSCHWFDWNSIFTSNCPECATVSEWQRPVLDPAVPTSESDTTRCQG